MMTYGTAWANSTRKRSRASAKSMDAVAAADVAAMVPMSAEKGAITDTKTIITMKVNVLIVINKIEVRLRDAPVNEAAKTAVPSDASFPYS